MDIERYLSVDLAADKPVVAAALLEPRVGRIDLGTNPLVGPGDVLSAVSRQPAVADYSWIADC